MTQASSPDSGDRLLLRGPMRLYRQGTVPLAVLRVHDVHQRRLSVEEKRVEIETEHKSQFHIKMNCTCEVNETAAKINFSTWIECKRGCDFRSGEKSLLQARINDKPG